MVPSVHRCSKVSYPINCPRPPPPPVPPCGLAQVLTSEPAERLPQDSLLSEGLPSTDAVTAGACRSSPLSAATPAAVPEVDAPAPSPTDRGVLVEPTRPPWAIARGHGGSWGSAGRTSLCAAVCLGHTSEVWELLLRGADANDWDPLEGRSLAEAAVRGKFEKIAVGLFARGADPNIRCVSDGTLLHVAAMGGSKIIVQALLANGADKDALDDFGETPLSKASHFGRKGVAETLMAVGCDVNVRGTGPSRFSPHRQGCSERVSAESRMQTVAAADG